MLHINMATKKSTDVVRSFGWLPDYPDFRDHLYSSPKPVAPKNFPKSIDLRPQCPPVLDQKTLGSCTSQAIASAHRFAQMKQKAPDFAPSRLFIYWNERFLEGTVGVDSGAMIRDGFKTIANDGVPPETLWPYDIAKFADKPPVEAYTAALDHQAIKYQRLDDPSLGPREAVLKQALLDGNPVVFGFSVFSSFQSQYAARVGEISMPGRRESSLGGHAVLLVGYDTKGRWIVMNSWGAGWGKKGFFLMPKEYLLSENLSADMWALQVIE